jgi:hypothetical protein
VVDAVVSPEPDDPAHTRFNPCAPARFCDQADVFGLTDDSPLYGRGVAWVDVDGDGWEDLWLSHDRFFLAGWDRTSTLYRNLEGTGFETLDLGLTGTHTLANWGGIWGDYDNDGDPDLYLANGGYSGKHPDRLYRNDWSDGGTFTEVTALAGLDLTPRMSWGASWADVDRDGWLDLVVSHRSAVQDAPCCAAGSGAGDPETSPVLLYRNLGDGHFEEVGAAWGLADTRLDGKNPTWLDYDMDGWPDLFLANAGDAARAALVPSYTPGLAGTARLLRNVEGAHFEDVSADAIDAQWLEPVFAAATLDANQDGWDDLYLGRAFQQDVLLLNQRDGTFAPDTRGLDMGLGFEAHENTMGLGVGDLDADGHPEVYVGTGWPNFQGTPIVYRHRGRSGGFERRADLGGLKIASNHGAAMSDFDHDGDVDMAWNLGAFSLWDAATREDHRAHPALMVNHGEPMRTVTVRLVGTVSNRDAFGARLTVEGSETHHVARHGTTGFQSWNGPWATLPLGAADSGVVTVRWPAGAEQRVAVSAGTRVTITEPR